MFRQRKSDIQYNLLRGNLKKVVTTIRDCIKTTEQLEKVKNDNVLDIPFFVALHRVQQIVFFCGHINKNLL